MKKKSLAMFLCVLVIAFMLPTKSFAKELTEAIDNTEFAEQETPVGDDAIGLSENNTFGAVEADRIRVVFVCDPIETVLSVFEYGLDGSKVEVFQNPDGAYNVDPQLRHVFTAVCDGYSPLENIDFFINSVEENIINITLCLENSDPFAYSPVDEIHAAAAPAGAGSHVMDGGKRDFRWPVPSGYGLSSCFKDGRNHDAIDIVGVGSGSTVIASYNGTVCEVGYGGGYGHYVIIRHNYTLNTGESRTLYSKYNHLQSYDVSNGQSVSAGQRIAGIGNSGGDYPVHLDFQIMTSQDWGNYNYHNISIDPYVNELLELPAGLYIASTDSCCGVGPSACCCKQYIDYIRNNIYNKPLPSPSSYLDLNGSIDGVSKGHIADAGVADVYIYKNGTLVESNTRITDYYTAWPSGTTYEINNIRGFGYQYNGVQPITGTIENSNVTVVLPFTTIPESSTAANSITYNNHRYERYDYHLSWTEAKTFCENKGGHLVTITSEQENEAVKGLLSGCPFGVYFIGATDPNRSGNWSWVTGEPFIYENWDPDSEPSQGQEEYYSQIIGQINPPNKQIGEWNDVENNGGGDFYSKKNTGFICEYETVYTISYNANGGTGAPANQTKIDGKVLTLSTIQPSREGQYHFIGWALSAGAKQAEYLPGGSFAIDANTTLYAVWERLYYLAYDPNGGADAPDGPGYIHSMSEVTLSTLRPTRDGYQFTGWAKSPTAVTPEYQPGDPITITEDTTLYAVWKRVYVSDWSETRPDGVKDALIETKTQYRYATKEITTSTSSTMPGWTLSGSQEVWGDYGAWSDWSLDAVSESENRQVETTALYRYYYFYCSNPNCNRHEPYSGYCDCGTQIVGFSIKWSPIPYNQSAPVSCDSRKMYTTSLGDGQRWNFSSGNLNASAIGTKDTDSDATVIDTGYRYRTRTANTLYTFYRWTDMTEWGDTPVEASESVSVETRTLYRCVIDEDRVMTLPSALTKIESEAFVNIDADAVIIPESMRSIADDAFETGTVIIGKPNSYAQLYAGWNNLLFIPIDD